MKQRCIETSLDSVSEKWARHLSTATFNSTCNAIATSSRLTPSTAPEHPVGEPEWKLVACCRVCYPISPKKLPTGVSNLEFYARRDVNIATVPSFISTFPSKANNFKRKQTA
jgi:hypothetical protein